MRRIALKSLKVSPLLLLGYAICSDSNQQKIHQQTSQEGIVFKNRKQHIQDVKENSNYDVVVIGGGASGAGVAIDASTRGLRTLVI